MKKFFILSVLLTLSSFIAFSFTPFSIEKKPCCDEKNIELDSLKTEYVFVLVIDGPRFSETFGDSTHRYIPNLANQLAPQGVLIKKFKNNGSTYTNAGHTAISTGVYQRMKNDGSQLPSYPGFLHYYLKEKQTDANDAYLITSKGKLNVLGQTKNKKWKNEVLSPARYCGVDGSEVGYANDRNTWNQAQKIFNEHHPSLVLMNILEPDAEAHGGSWEKYLQGIVNTDKIALELWNFIQNDSIYKNKTTLFITNDHGRHLDGIKNGFESHGCSCDGCRNIYLIALGPDFNQGLVLNEMYEQIDISKTISVMLNFVMPTSDGKLMKCLFKE